MGGGGVGGGWWWWRGVVGGRRQASKIRFRFGGCQTSAVGKKRAQALEIVRRVMYWEYLWENHTASHHKKVYYPKSRRVIVESP